MEHLLGISLNILWADTSFCPTITPVIPNQNVALLVQKVFKVECVREVYHMLVGQGVRVAKYNCVKRLVLRWLIFRGKLNGDLRRIDCLKVKISR